MDDLKGRVALVTGSATGLGRSIAVKLAERGADVIINYSRSSAEAEEAADQCRTAGAEVAVVQANVADPDGCHALADAAGQWGKLDILANNAGITRHARDHADLDALSRMVFSDANMHEHLCIPFASLKRAVAARDGRYPRRILHQGQEGSALRRGVKQRLDLRVLGDHAAGALDLGRERERLGNLVGGRHRWTAFEL